MRQRKRRSSPEDAPNDITWIYRSGALMDAIKIINRHKERPYILSIPDEGGAEPVCGLYPCTMTRRNGRIYYSFLIRDHREQVCQQWEHARRELTG